MESFIDNMLGSEVDKKAVSAAVRLLENQLVSPSDGRLSGAKYTTNSLPHSIDSKRSNQVSASSNSRQIATGSPTVTGKSSYNSNSRSNFCSSTPNISPIPVVTSTVLPDGNRSTRGQFISRAKLVSTAMSVPRTNTPQITVQSPQIHSMQQSGSTQRRTAIKQEQTSSKQPPALLNNQHIPGKPVLNHAMVMRNKFAKTIANHLPQSTAIKSVSTILTQHSNTTAVQNYATAIQAQWVSNRTKERAAKLESFFTRLITLATSISPEIGKYVQELIKALV
ncbi:Hypothetical predicted protein, partial [Paramuricea clavata]